MWSPSRPSRDEPHEPLALLPAEASEERPLDFGHELLHDGGREEVGDFGEHGVVGQPEGLAVARILRLDACGCGPEAVSDLGFGVHAVWRHGYASSTQSATISRWRS